MAPKFAIEVPNCLSRRLKQQTGDLDLDGVACLTVGKNVVHGVETVREPELAGSLRLVDQLARDGLRARDDETGVGIVPVDLEPLGVSPESAPIAE